MAVPVEIAGRGNRRTHPSCLKIPSECRPGVAPHLRRRPTSWTPVELHSDFPEAYL